MPSDMHREVAAGYRYVGTLPGPGPWSLVSSRGGIVGVSPNWPNAVFIARDEMREIKVQYSDYRDALLERARSSVQASDPAAQ